MKHATWILLLTLGVVSQSAQATLVYGGGTVPNLRVESGYGFIAVSNVFTGTTCDTTRAWVNMSTDQGRAAYATAMLAFMTQKSVVIRLDDTSLQIFGACALYDIYVSQ